MKPAVLRPQALRDQQGEVRYYRKEGGARLAVKVVNKDSNSHDLTIKCSVTTHGSVGASSTRDIGKGPCTVTVKKTGASATGNGSDELIHLIGLLFLTPNSNMVVGKPSFVRYNAAAQIAGCELREVPLNARYEFDVDAMAAACDANTKIVWLANPNNPTGTITRRAELDRLLEKMPASAVLVLDEAYFEYACAEPDYPDSLDYLRRGAPVIGLRTMSKAYGLAGIRVGYGFAPVEIASAINGAKEPFSLNSLAQVAAIAALSDADHVQNSLQLNEMGRRRLMEALLQLDVEPIESYANFVLVDMKQAAEPLFRAMLAQGVIVRSGHVLGLPECLRISIGTEYEVSRCIDALHAVLKKPVAP